MRLYFFNKKVLFMSIARLIFTIVYKIACQFFEFLIEKREKKCISGPYSPSRKHTFISHVRLGWKVE